MRMYFIRKWSMVLDMYLIVATCFFGFDAKGQRKFYTGTAALNVGAHFKTARYI